MTEPNHHLIQMHIARLLRRTNPHGDPAKLTAHAAVGAATNAFSLTSDGVLAAFDDGKGSLDKARAWDPAFLRSVGFQTGLQPVPHETLAERLDRRLRLMGAGSFDEAMNGDDDGSPFPGTGGEAA